MFFARLLHYLNCLIIVFISVQYLLAPVQAQNFMMQGWYWDYPKTANGANWADTINNKAAEIGNAGFTHLWLPPLSRASFGSASNGYDVRDLYDLGEYGLGPTGFGSRGQVDALINVCANNGIDVVADVVYNHRDGGSPEDNPAVQGWIENYTCNKVDAGDAPYPSDRVRWYLPLGGTSTNQTGDYYIKVRSASTHPNFYNKGYRLYLWTNEVGYQNNPDLNETEGTGNGGGDCGQAHDPTSLLLGTSFFATLDEVFTCGGNCGIDEFKLTLNASDFEATGDTLYIVLDNQNGDYADQRIIGMWNASAGQDVAQQLRAQTYTNFNQVASGQGLMDYTNFKPNGNPTNLSGDWDGMWFFYDYDQMVTDTRDKLTDWTRWLWNDVGIRGFRMDAVKHFDPAFLGHVFNTLHAEGIMPSMVVGEVYDSNAGVLNNWLSATMAQLEPQVLNDVYMRVFDFSLRESLKNACDSFGYDARNVFNAGLVDEVGASQFNVVTFVNNHDFRDYGQAIQNDPMLAYAYILTNNQVGLPCVFYPDYYGVELPEGPTQYLKPAIDTLLKIHQTHIHLAPNATYLNNFGTTYSSNYISGYPETTLLYQISGGTSGQEVVVAINFAGDTLKLDHEINLTNLNVGDELQDVIGNAIFPTAVVSASNQMYIELPPRSYAVWVSCDNGLCTPPSNLVSLQAKVWLEGAYDTNANSMHTQLLDNNLLPSSQPYAVAPWFYNGTEQITAQNGFPSAVVDWVLVEARSANDYTLILEQQAAFLRNDATLVNSNGEENIYFETLTNGEYYHISIRHRNHVGGLTAMPIQLPNATPLNFGTATNVLASAGQLVPINANTYALRAADCHPDGIINYHDFGVYTGQMATNGYLPADVNLDGQVNNHDFNLYINNNSFIGIDVIRY